MSYLIQFRERPRDAWEVYGNLAMPRAQAVDAARRLKAELREKNPRAQVAVNGKVLKERRPTCPQPST